MGDMEGVMGGYVAPDWASDFYFYVYFRKARKLLHPVRCEQSPRSNAAPQIHMRVGPCNSNAETRGPRKPLPGHGLRHLPHLAAGLRQC